MARYLAERLAVRRAEDHLPGADQAEGAVDEQARRLTATRDCLARTRSGTAGPIRVLFGSVRPSHHRFLSRVVRGDEPSLAVEARGLRRRLRAYAAVRLLGGPAAMAWVESALEPPGSVVAIEPESRIEPTPVEVAPEPEPGGVDVAIVIDQDTDRGEPDVPALEIPTVVLDIDEVITNSIGVELLLIPAGVFLMGSDDGKDDEAPVYKVTLTRSSYLGTTEVTQAQWVAVMGSNPAAKAGDDLPVERVSWEDATNFC